MVCLPDSTENPSRMILSAVFHRYKHALAKGLDSLILRTGMMTEATAKDGVSLTHREAGECSVLRCHLGSQTVRIGTVHLPLVTSMTLGEFLIALCHSFFSVK